MTLGDQFILIGFVLLALAFAGHSFVMRWIRDTRIHFVGSWRVEIIIASTASIVAIGFLMNRAPDMAHPFKITGLLVAGATFMAMGVDGLPMDIVRAWRARQQFLAQH